MPSNIDASSDSRRTPLASVKTKPLPKSVFGVWRAIVTLFERAEEGDFSGEYDDAADRRPDAITRVGLAYNRVRLHLASLVLTDPLEGTDG